MGDKSTVEDADGVSLTIRKRKFNFGGRVFDESCGQFEMFKSKG